MKFRSYLLIFEFQNKIHVRYICPDIGSSFSMFVGKDNIINNPIFPNNIKDGYIINIDNRFRENYIYFLSELELILTLPKYKSFIKKFNHTMSLFYDEWFTNLDIDDSDFDIDKSD